MSDDDKPEDPGRKGGRFAPGHSGNPRGRPRKTVTADEAIHRAAMERVSINENGKSRRISKLDAGAKQLANKSASGDLKAMRMVITSSRAKASDAADGTRVSEPTTNDQAVIARLVARIQTYGAKQ